MKVYCAECIFWDHEVGSNSYRKCLENPVEEDTPIIRKMNYADPMDKNKNNSCKAYTKDIKVGDIQLEMLK